MSQGPPLFEKDDEIKLKDDGWYHGKITRKRAEELLKPAQDGLFLIRESETFPGDFTLSVCCGTKVGHYHILQKDNKLTIDEKSHFNNLSKLVEHYKKDAYGLCTKLVRPVELQKNETWKGAFGDVNKQLKDTKQKLQL